MKALACALLSVSIVAGVASAQEAKVLERAKAEGSVTVFTSMQLADSRPLAEAFEKKYGIKVSLWRASGGKVAQRVSLYVLAYNTRLVAPHEVPNTYEDLLEPRWAGKLA